MTTKDITVDGNLTNNTTPATTDRLLLVDAGTNALQDITLAALPGGFNVTAPVTNTSGTLAVSAASTTASGVSELAISSEVDTGTDATRAVTPDALAGSYAGKASVSALVQSGTITTGDGKIYILMPAKTNGMNLVGGHISVITTSSSGTPTVQIARGRQANATSAHTFNDMLSTRFTIDANEYSSLNATTAAVINGTYDDIQTGDLIRVDIDVIGTGTANLYIYLEFQLP